MFFRRLPILLTAALLAGCGIPLPTNIDLPIDGTYTGRVVGKDGQDRYAVTVTSSGLRVTATFKNRDTGQEVVLSGQRSALGNTPVKVTARGGVGSGTPCPDGFTDVYVMDVDFYASQPGRGLGSLWHESCDATGAGFVANLQGSGLLELNKQ